MKKHFDNEILVWLAILIVAALFAFIMTGLAYQKEEAPEAHTASIPTSVTVINPNE